MHTTCPVTQGQQSSLVLQCCFSAADLNEQTALKRMQNKSHGLGLTNAIRWETSARVNGMGVLAKASVCLAALYVQIRVKHKRVIYPEITKICTPVF